LAFREAKLADLIRPGMTVAVGDGFGAPRAVSAELSSAAARAGGVRLILGWVPLADPDLDFAAFADVRTVLPGWGLRDGVAAGLVRFPPVRLSAVPALLHGPWRPDLLVASLVPADGGYAFGCEVSWQRAAIGAGATVAAVISRGAPRADAGEPLDSGRVVVVGQETAPPGVLRDMPPTAEHEEIARRVASLIHEGVRLQVGPSPVGDALLRRLTVPVAIDSGLLPDSVTDLASRGLLIGDPVATYLAGGPRLYSWADGRPILHPVEYTHDLGRLSAGPFIAVNTAVEIDFDGQVNVEGTASAVLGGLGGGRPLGRRPVRHHGHDTAQRQADARQPAVPPGQHAVAGRRHRRHRARRGRPPRPVPPGTPQGPQRLVGHLTAQTE
jgi:acyl-CoA hydrolase